MKNTFYENEAREVYEMLRQHGLNPMVCDTPVPFYDVDVRAGLPTAPGDIVEGEYLLLPRQLVKMGITFAVRAKGDSMKDVGIASGDKLQVCADGVYGDGDTVVADIDGELTVKSYFRDRQGRQWLVPANEDYDPIALDEDSGARIIGRVVEVIKEMPRMSHSEIMKIMDRVHKDKPSTTLSRQEKPEKIICRVAHMVKHKRQWYAVYRALVDQKLLDKDMFATFSDLVAQHLPHHEHIPSAGLMRRMATQSFRKPIALWDAEDAPVSGARFEDYMRIARECFRG